MKPRLFISAVTSEFGKARQLAANVLLRLGYDPVWQDIFGTEAGDLRKMLRDKIDDCDGLVHLVGRAYGFEPPSPDPEFGRVSYTQYELLYAQQVGKRTWVLFAEDGFPSDRPPEQLDLPPDATHAEPMAYQAQRRALQDAWRQRLRGESHLWHAATTTTEFELQLERMKDEFRQLRSSFGAWQRNVTRNLALVVGLIVIFGAAVIWWILRQPGEVEHVVQKSIAQTIDSQTPQIAQAVMDRQMAELKPELIKSQFRKQIEDTYTADVAAAEKLPDWRKRESAKQDAAAARDRKLQQVDQYVTAINGVLQSGEATPEYLELMRILQEQGVEQASAYITREESRLLKNVSQVPQDKRDDFRTRMAPLLEGITLHQSRGTYNEAAKLCVKLLALDPDWPEVWQQNIAVQKELGERAEKYQTLAAAKEHYAAGLTSARRQAELPATRRLSHINLAMFLERLGDLALAQGSLAEAEKLFLESQQHTQALIDAEPQQLLWLRNQSLTYRRLSKLAWQRGKVDDALKYAAQQFALCQQVAEKEPDNTGWQRDLAIAHDQLGNIELDRGTYAGKTAFPEAKKHYQASLKIRQKLAQQDVKNLQSRHDLGVSYSLLGACAQAEGDLPAAVEYFKQQIDVMQSLLKSDPNDAAYKDSLSVAWSQLSAAQQLQGNNADAEHSVQQSLKISEQLSQTDPQNTVWKRDITVALDRLGNMAMLRKDLAAAESHFQKSLALRKELAKVDPANGLWQRDLNISHVKMAEVAMAQQRFDDAWQQASDAVAICQGLTSSNPGNERWQRDLAVACIALGNAALQQQKLDEAQQHYTEALAIRRKLAEAEPANADRRRDQWITHWYLADLLDKKKDAAAREHWQAAHDILAAMIADQLSVSDADRKWLDEMKAKLKK